MARVSLTAVALFLAIYLLSWRFNDSQRYNDGESDMVGPQIAGFLIAVIAALAVLSLIFNLSQFGKSFAGLPQKAVALFNVIRAFYRSRFGSSVTLGVFTLK